jgi:hypothetical protein
METLLEELKAIEERRLEILYEIYIKDKYDIV